MYLNDYFAKAEGTGILSTSDAEGNVNAAVYATPHVIDESTVAFIMRPRRSLANVNANPKAAYLFMEKKPGHHGLRLYLEKIGQETDAKKVNLLRRSHHGGDESEAVLVYFKVTGIRPLVGDGQVWDDKK